MFYCSDKPSIWGWYIGGEVGYSEGTLENN
jgi:hypothetical protein